MAVSRFNPDYPDAGLVLLNKTDFTGASSVSVNNVFSSTYDNYLILVSARCSVDNKNLILRLGSGGSYAATNIYSFGYINVTRAGGTTTENGNAVSGYRLNRMETTNNSSSQCFIFGPNLATETRLTLQGWNRRDNFAYNGGGYIESSTQYTDLRILPESDNMTGTIQIYGYKNEV